MFWRRHARQGSGSFFSKEACFVQSNRLSPLESCYKKVEKDKKIKFPISSLPSLNPKTKQCPGYQILKAYIVTILGMYKSTVGESFTLGKTPVYPLFVLFPSLHRETTPVLVLSEYQFDTWWIFTYRWMHTTHDECLLLVCWLWWKEKDLSKSMVRMNENFSLHGERSEIFFFFLKLCKSTLPNNPILVLIYPATKISR